MTIQTQTDYKKAVKLLRKVGCSKASGDSLRAMYAPLIRLNSCLSDVADSYFFKHLQKFSQDSEISAEARRLMRTPIEASNIFFDNMGLLSSS